MQQSTSTLIRCPDCGAQISPSAPTCLKCGRPMGDKPDQKAKVGRYALRGFVLAMAVGFLGSHASCEPRSFEEGKYFFFNFVIALFIGAVGGGIGAAVSGLKK